MPPADDRRARRRRALLAGGVVVLVAVVGAVLAGTWYRTLSEGEQRADERGYEQVAVLLLRRIDREGPSRLDAIVDDFDVAADAHIVVVDEARPLASPGTPPAVLRHLVRFEEPDVLVVRRRTARIDDVGYELFGGASQNGIRSYVVREASPPERATTLRPVLAVGWAVTVVTAAAIAFAVGRRREHELRRARERERSLTSAIAHDLRTPLASMITSASLLEAQSDRLPAEARRPAAVLATELSRLRTLVEDLLELARLEAGDHALHVEVVAVADVVRDVLAARSWTGVRPSLDDRAAAAVDRLSLSRIVLNLVDNALRHGAGPVEVRVRRDDGDVVLEVTDGGTAADAEHLRRMLDGVAPTRGAGRRPGLGLRIAQQNAELHGSRIAVTVDPRAGTTFRLRLPAEAPIAGRGP